MANQHAQDLKAGAQGPHTMPDGTKRPVAFASRTLSSSERNYSQVEKEALSLIFGIKKFDQYLYGRAFTLNTDHKPLITILGPKNGVPSIAAARMQRWALLLSAYSYTIQFRSTQAHGNVDGLSRLPLPADVTVGNSKDTTDFNIHQNKSLPLQASDIATATRRDPILSRVLVCLKQGWPTNVPESLRTYWRKRNEITVEGDVLLWGLRVIIPHGSRNQILKDLHCGHQGIAKMKTLARSHVWWPTIDRDLEETVKGCLPCQEQSKAPPKAQLNPWSWPQVPWDRVHIDFAGPVRGKMLLIMVDTHSKSGRRCMS